MTDQDDSNVRFEHLDISLLPKEEQFPFYVEEFCRRQAALNISLYGKQDNFPFKLICADTDDQVCSTVSCPPLTVERSEQLIKSEPSSMVSLVYGISGSAQVESGDLRLTFGPGDFFLYNADIPFKAKNANNTMKTDIVIYNLPAHKLNQFHASQQGAFGTDINWHRYAPLLRNVSAELQRAMKQRNVTATQKLTPIATSLLDFMLFIEQATPNERVDDRTFHLLQATIEQSLSDPKFDISKAAHRLNISTAEIELLMQRRDTSFSDYLWQSRTNQALAKLTAPQFANQTMEDIAKGTGFPNMTIFYEKLGKTIKTHLFDPQIDMSEKPNRLN